MGKVGQKSRACPQNAHLWGDNNRLPTSSGISMGHQNCSERRFPEFLRERYIPHGTMAWQLFQDSEPGEARWTAYAPCQSKSPSAEFESATFWSATRVLCTAHEPAVFHRRWNSAKRTAGAPFALRSNESSASDVGT
jgi:hypothetical protein